MYTYSKTQIETRTLLYIYAQEDIWLRDLLAEHLRPLVQQKLIAPWCDRDIPAGSEWETVLKERLDTAQIILLLISANFMRSNLYCIFQASQALERHQRGEACVIPIILRHCDWHGEAFKHLQAIPCDEESLAHWRSPHDAIEEGWLSSCSPAWRASSTQAIFACYVEAMLAHHGKLRTGKKTQAKQWLGLLAVQMQRRHQAIFEVGMLQPNWLSGKPHLLYHASIGLVFGAIAGLLLGMLSGPITGLFGGIAFALYKTCSLKVLSDRAFSTVQQVASASSKDIPIYLFNGIVLGLFLGLLEALHLGLFDGLLVGLFAGAYVTLGGYAEHGIVRILLRSQTPKNLTAFLDEMTECFLLDKVGNDYMFKQRELQNYFVTLNRNARQQ